MGVGKKNGMDGGRRTDGIVVMEVPVYDPSGRKRKSHEWWRDERAKKRVRDERRERKRDQRERAKRTRETGRTSERAGRREGTAKEKAWRRQDD